VPVLNYVGKSIRLCKPFSNFTEHKRPAGIRAFLFTDSDRYADKATELGITVIREYDTSPTGIPVFKGMFKKLAAASPCSRNSFIFDGYLNAGTSQSPWPIPVANEPTLDFVVCDLQVTKLLNDPTFPSRYPIHNRTRQDHARGPTTLASGGRFSTFQDNFLARRLWTLVLIVPHAPYSGDQETATCADDRTAYQYQP
jgi:hypothetical protein